MTKMKTRRLAVLAASVLALVTVGCTAAPVADQDGGGDKQLALATTTNGPPPAKPDAQRIAKDPGDIPAPIGQREPATVVVELETVELVGQLADGTTYEYWTFGGTVPGPMVRVRVGDTVELRLRNAADSRQPHSIDLHAVTGPGGGAAATQVLPGEDKAFQFKALQPGVYVYHCATPYIPAHVANGLYGVIVVEPEGGLEPVDREFYIMQGEIYADLRPGEQGHAEFDGDALFDEVPNYVVFNGQYQALTGKHAMRAKVGERIRLFVGNGGATWVEFAVDYPGSYVLVDHALQRAVGKGAIATI